MKEIKWYSIMNLKGSLFADANLVQDYNSKDALEKLIHKKVKRVLRNNEPADYSVALSNEKGFYYRDARRTIYYKII